MPPDSLLGARISAEEALRGIAGAENVRLGRRPRFRRRRARARWSSSREASRSFPPCCGMRMKPGCAWRRAAEAPSSTWGNPPARVDLIVSTARLNQIIEHAWADLTVTVEAGCTMQNLQERLAQHGQRLALDAMWPERATVGGVLSTNDSGALRLRFGGMRDLDHRRDAGAARWNAGPQRRKSGQERSGLRPAEISHRSAGNAGHNYTRRLPPASLAAKHAHALDLRGRSCGDAALPAWLSRTRNSRRARCRFACRRARRRKSTSSLKALRRDCEAQEAHLRDLVEPLPVTESGAEAWAGAPASLVLCKNRGCRENQHAAGGDRDRTRRRASSYVRASRAVERRGAGHRSRLAPARRQPRKPCTCRCRNCAPCSNAGRLARDPAPPGRHDAA